MTDRQILYEFQKFLLILGGLVVVWFVFSNLKIIARKVLANVQRDLRFKEFNWRSKLTISAEISLHSHFGEKKYLNIFKNIYQLFSLLCCLCVLQLVVRSGQWYWQYQTPHITFLLAMCDISYDFFSLCVTYHMSTTCIHIV